MAIYEYKCSDCGEISEHLVFSSEDEVACEKCGSKNLEKLLSGFAVSVKAGSSSGNPNPGCQFSGSCGGNCPGGM